MVKCIKCGVEIPDSASFCPNCGSAKPEEQKVSQPVYRSMKKSTFHSSPLEDIFNIVFSKTAITLVIAFGILFSWVGIIIMIFASGSADVSRLLISIGFSGMSFFLVGGGIWNTKIEKFVRFAMVLMGIFLVIQLLSVIGLYSWMI